MAPPSKIKGGRWTVARFALVSIAYSSVWLAVSSQLGYYRSLHGPQVLLQLNVAYFLPSIPLLVLSAYLDRPLEAQYGVARTILIRLILGLVGYGAISASFPFQPTTIYWLLGSTVALGLFSCIAFSASYQLVARFANKNVIALGLGNSASGPLVLALQLAFNVGPRPTHAKLVLLYESITLIVAAGLWATVSLLFRHWDAIEASSHGAADAAPAAEAEAAEAGGLSQPLLAAAEGGMEQQQQQQGAVGIPAARRPPGPWAGAASPSPDLSGSLLGSTPTRSLWKQASLPPLAHYSSVEPFASPLPTEDIEIPRTTSWGQPGSAGVSSPAGGRLILDGTAHGQQQEQQAEAAASKVRDGAAAALQGSCMVQQQEGGSVTLLVLQTIWAPLLALFISSTIALTVFPFFTYVPSSGLMGDSLPMTLFFARIFADVLGRFLPRLKTLAPQVPLAVLATAGAKAACVPVFFLYLKSPDGWHSDVAAVIFVAAVWCLGGYINTAANLLAPKLVAPQHKGRAAGSMALAYQIAHFVGLALATGLALALYGSITIEG